MTARRWRYEWPGPPGDHRRHELKTVCHRWDGRGRPRLAARLCLTCKVIIREWRLCGRTTQDGHPCLRPAIVIKGAPWPCSLHQPARWVGRGVRSSRKAS